MRGSMTGRHEGCVSTMLTDSGLSIALGVRRFKGLGDGIVVARRQAPCCRVLSVLTPRAIALSCNEECGHVARCGAGRRTAPRAMGCPWCCHSEDGNALRVRCELPRRTFQASFAWGRGLRESQPTPDATQLSVGIQSSRPFRATDLSRFFGPLDSGRTAPIRRHGRSRSVRASARRCSARTTRRRVILRRLSDKSADGRATGHWQAFEPVGSAASFRRNLLTSGERSVAIGGAQPPKQTTFGRVARCVARSLRQATVGVKHRSPR